MVKTFARSNKNLSLQSAERYTCQTFVITVNPRSFLVKTHAASAHDRPTPLLREIFLTTYSISVPETGRLFHVSMWAFDLNMLTASVQRGFY